MIVQELTDLMSDHSDILLCILFGSIANQRESVESDLDVAIAGERAFTAEQKQDFIEELATAFGRPVDLVDLQLISGTLLHQILTKGELIFCRDHQLYAELMKKMLFNQSDMMPYYYRILKERRKKWINE